MARRSASDAGESSLLFFMTLLVEVVVHRAGRSDTPTPPAPRAQPGTRATRRCGPLHRALARSGPRGVDAESTEPAGRGVRPAAPAAVTSGRRACPACTS